MLQAKRGNTWLTLAAECLSSPWGALEEEEEEEWGAEVRERGVEGV